MPQIRGYLKDDVKGRNGLGTLSTVRKRYIPIYGCVEKCRYFELCKQSLKRQLPLMCEDFYEGEYTQLSRDDRDINLYPTNTFREVTIIG